MQKRQFVPVSTMGRFKRILLLISIAVSLSNSVPVAYNGKSSSSCTSFYLDKKCHIQLICTGKSLACIMLFFLLHFVPSNTDFNLDIQPFLFFDISPI